LRSNFLTRGIFERKRELDEQARAYSLSPSHKTPKKKKKRGLSFDVYSFNQEGGDAHVGKGFAEQSLGASHRSGGGGGKGGGENATRFNLIFPLVKGGMKEGGVGYMRKKKGCPG